MPPRLGKIRNGGQRHGLWRWTSPGEIEPDDNDDNPRVRPCPACGVQAGPCRRRGRGGWTTMTGYHPARRAEGS